MLSCCSKHNECRNKGFCVRDPALEFYKNCSLNKLLVREQSPLSFKEPPSIEANFKVKDGINIPQENSSKNLFLNFNYKLYCIYGKGFGSSDLLSHSLSNDEFCSLLNAFKNAGIGYEHDMVLELCVDDEDISEPSNARCVLEIGERKYHVFNYDSRLIRVSECAFIKEMFENKGYKCDYEFVGSFSKIGTGTNGKVEEKAHIPKSDHSKIEGQESLF